MVQLNVDNVSKNPMAFMDPMDQQLEGTLLQQWVICAINTSTTTALSTAI